MIASKLPFRRHATPRPAVLLGDLDLLRPLAMRKVPVVLAAQSPADITLRSRHVHGHAILRESRPERTEDLIELGARLASAIGAPVPLFYGADADLELIYEARDELSRHYLFALNEPDLSWALHDKGRFAALAERAGVLSPRTVRGDSPDLPGALLGLREPSLVKPRQKAEWAPIKHDLLGHAGKARVFATRGEALSNDAVQRHKDGLVFQEHIEADVDDLHSFHGFASGSGQLLASFTGRKIRTYPRFAGESSFIELTCDPDVERAGRDVAARLGLKGPFKIDMVRDRRSGQIYTLEVNARYNLWHYLGAVHGVNLPAIAYDYLVEGRVAPPPKYVPRLRWQNLYRDYHSFREGEQPGLVDWVRSFASAEVIHEAFAWTDPLPSLKWLTDHVYHKVMA
jgi:D-aspartate ligase